MEEEILRETHKLRALYITPLNMYIHWIFVKVTNKTMKHKILLSNPFVRTNSSISTALADDDISYRLKLYKT